MDLSLLVAIQTGSSAAVLCKTSCRRYSVYIQATDSHAGHAQSRCTEVVFQDQSYYIVLCILLHYVELYYLVFSLFFIDEAEPVKALCEAPRGVPAQSSWSVPTQASCHVLSRAVLKITIFLWFLALMVPNPYFNTAEPTLKIEFCKSSQTQPSCDYRQLEPGIGGTCRGAKGFTVVQRFI